MREKKFENSDLDQASGFSLVYDHFSPLIWKHIFLRISLKEETNDLTSEVFLKTWDYLNSGRKIQKIKSFLYRTADNLVIDWYRSRKKIFSLEKDISEDEDVLIVESEMENNLMIAEDVVLLMKNINRLDEKEKRLLILRFVDDLKIDEISEVLSKSRGAVTVAIHRALKSLMVIVNAEKKDEKESVKEKQEEL